MSLKQFLAQDYWQIKQTKWSETNTNAFSKPGNTFYKVAFVSRATWHPAARGRWGHSKEPELPATFPYSRAVSQDTPVKSQSHFAFRWGWQKNAFFLNVMKELKKKNRISEHLFLLERIRGKCGIIYTQSMSWVFHRRSELLERIRVGAQAYEDIDGGLQLHLNRQGKGIVKFAVSKAMT